MFFASVITCSQKLQSAALAWRAPGPSGVMLNAWGKTHTVFNVCLCSFETGEQYTHVLCWSGL